MESVSSKPDASSVQWDAVLIPVGKETKETGASSVQWDAVLTPVSGEIVTADVPVVDHATTPATVLQSKGESEKRYVTGKSWNRSSAAWQRGSKSRKPSGAVTANIHPVCDNNNRDNGISYSQLPPGNGVPFDSLKDQPANIDFSLTSSPKKPSFELNPLAVEFVPASTDRDRQREEVYSADWTVGENCPRRNRKLPNKFADFCMGKGNVCRTSTALGSRPSIAVHNVKLCNAGRCTTRRIQHSVAGHQQQSRSTSTSSNTTCEMPRSCARGNCREARALKRDRRKHCPLPADSKVG